MRKHGFIFISSNPRTLSGIKGNSENAPEEQQDGGLLAWADSQEELSKTVHVTAHTGPSLCPFL